MLNNLKNLYKLQSQAHEIQKQLANKSVEVENHGIKIVMDGNQKVLSVKIKSELSKEEQEKYLVEAFNEAIKKVQQLMASSVMSFQVPQE